jgi:UDP-2-acetamido-3-amino-2,3-dideoxy-glucuronate N-acetyltransferase
MSLTLDWEEPRPYLLHPTAEVEPGATIGKGTKIWRNAHVREGARIGEDCIIGMGVFIDEGVVIGDRCKIQNYACIYKGVTIEDAVFIGPHVVFTNDRYPQAVDAESGELLKSGDWVLEKTHVEYGVVIGANATILCGLTLCQNSVIGAGAVVTKNTMRDYAKRGYVHTGNPARPTRPRPKRPRPLPFTTQKG